MDLNLKKLKKSKISKPSLTSKKVYEVLINQIHQGKNLENLDEKYIENKLDKFLLREGSLRKKIETEFSVNPETLCKQGLTKAYGLCEINSLKKNMSYVVGQSQNSKTVKNDITKVKDTFYKINKICPTLSDKKNLLKNKIFKEIVKKVRAEIGQVYGQFLTSDFKKRNKILESCKTKEDALQILKLHKSTRERTNYYNEIYFKIFTWYTPKYIADLACGLNPLSYFYIESNLKISPKYFTSDLGYEDMNFLNSYFKKFKINGIAKNYDITNLSILENKELQEADLVFLFKALDSFEEIKKNISKELLVEIPSKNIVISFPTKSLVSKKHIKINKRNWIIKFIKKQNWKLESFEVDNEIFFLINK